MLNGVLRNVEALFKRQNNDTGVFESRITAHGTQSIENDIGMYTNANAKRRKKNRSFIRFLRCVAAISYY